MPLNPNRVELHVLRVANGWMVQPIHVATSAVDPETGKPFVSNPSHIHIATTPEELAFHVRAWAYDQRSLWAAAQREAGIESVSLLRSAGDTLGR